MKRGLALLLVVMASALGLVACEGDAQKPAGTQAASAVSEKDIAVPADFADEADAQITATTYKAELDALDKEISAE